MFLKISGKLINLFYKCVYGNYKLSGSQQQRKNVNNSERG